MTGELNIGGVFLPLALPTAIAAFIVLFVFKRLLRKLDLYRFIWHAGLFDTAIFVVLWWLITAAIA